MLFKEYYNNKQYLNTECSKYFPMLLCVLNCKKTNFWTKEYLGFGTNNNGVFTDQGLENNSLMI